MNPVTTMYIFKLLAPWQRGKGFDDAVFRAAATLPLKMVEHKSYMISGDEQFGFDPNAFAQRLVDETGVPFVWDPIATRVPEGQRLFSFTSIDNQGPERQAKQQTRELVWMIWKRFSPLFSRSDKELAGQLQLSGEQLVCRMTVPRSVTCVTHRCVAYRPPKPLFRESLGDMSSRPTWLTCLPGLP